MYLFLVCLCVCASMWLVTCMPRCRWKVRGQVAGKKIYVFSYNVDSRNQTEVVRPGDNCLYLPSHLTSSGSWQQWLTCRVWGCLSDGMKYLHVPDVVYIERLFQTNDEPLQRVRTKTTKHEEALGQHVPCSH